MEAIAELIAALIGALLEGIFALLQGVFSLLAVVLEFIFVALFHGVDAASKQYQHRQEERSEKLATAKNNRQAERAAQLEVAEKVAATSRQNNEPTISRNQTVILVLLVCFIIIGGVATWMIRDRIRKQRIAETRSQIKKLANTFSAQIQDKEMADPVPGKLHDRDAWNQPIELFVDKTLLGSLIVVRSSGPDRRSGSIDDLLETHVVQASVKEVGGELAHRGWKALRNRVNNFLPGGEKEKQPAENDVSED
ncbi:hypothetical protein Mal35_44060 [Gimesia maris]|uniref:hypothetical protein n=1 Tax=Gimesia maris TaxID=122 RepID=UPI001189B762|nr:hypothetical protein [Gimesia maris]QDT80931.1 hypothetical protein Mal35_44060 [Gimesia maris]